MLHCLLTGFDPLRGLLWTSVGGHFYGVRVNRVDDSGFKTDRREWTHTPFLYRFPNVVSPNIWLILEREISENNFPTHSFVWKISQNSNREILAHNFGKTLYIWSTVNVVEFHPLFGGTDGGCWYWYVLWWIENVRVARILTFYLL